MVDSPPQKNDEQYPLLKVASGGGDSGRPPAQPHGSPGWSVTCTPKRSWFDRWPEIISAFWMTGMLLSIFVLIVYGLGTLGVIRKQPIFFLKCNATRPDNEVYFHHIIKRGEPVPFNRFSEYLSNTALQYPSLYFSVFFLIDDSIQHVFKGPKHSKLLSKLFTYQSSRNDELYFDAINQRELSNFHIKFPTVNVTVMLLSKFMGMTPLKYKWRTVPLGYLTFYARVFSVWKNGGIGIDLETFSNQYNKHQMSDRRFIAIMKQYNKGSKPEEYVETLNNIDRDEQNNFLQMIHGIVHLILNESRSFLNRSLNFNQETSAPVRRTQRNKREVMELIQTSGNETVVPPETNLINTSDITIINSPYRNIDNVKNISTIDKLPHIGDIHLKSLLGDSKQDNKSVSLLEKSIKHGSEGPQVLLFYDFSVFSDNMGPPYAFSEPMQASAPQSHNNYGEDEIIMNINKKKQASFFLSLTFEGSFIAAVSKQHPLLGHIISGGCQRQNPRHAIQDAIISQCSPILNDEMYCSNIYVF